MISKQFFTRILSKDDFNLVGSMEKIEFRTQKNAWNAQSLIECFDDSYIIIGLFKTKSLIGFSVIYNTKFTTDLLTIGVDPDYQGKKLGALLLRDTLSVALANQVQECFLEVRVSNVVALNLYKKFGFKVVGTRPAYYNPVGNSPAEDAYTMHLCDLKENLDRMLSL